MATSCDDKSYDALNYPCNADPIIHDHPRSADVSSRQLDLRADRLCVREIEREDGRCLRISQCQTGDVGCVVWDAALVLAHYLDCPSMRDGDGVSLMRGRRVVELGAGTGVVGLQAAACGAHCLVTDLAEFVPLMDLNIANNQSIVAGHVEAKQHDWGSDVASLLPQPDYILIADCIYYEQSLSPLVKTIEDLSNESTVVLCCYEKRTTGDKPRLERQFFELISRQFQLEDVPTEAQHPLFSSDDIRIVKMTRR